MALSWRCAYELFLYRGRFGAAVVMCSALFHKTISYFLPLSFCLRPRQSDYVFSPSRVYSTINEKKQDDHPMVRHFCFSIGEIET